MSVFGLMYMYLLFKPILVKRNACSVALKRWIFRYVSSSGTR